MRLIRYLSPASLSFLPEKAEERVVGLTVGNFDALHRGHYLLFERLREQVSELARSQQKKPRLGLLTFWPHPRQVLSGINREQRAEDSQYFTVLTLRKKLELIRSAGFDFCGLVHFRRSFAKLLPQDFIESYLYQPFQPSLIVIGDDWAFGKGRSGNPETLREAGKTLGFEVDAVPGFSLLDHRVSTSAVKQAVKAGDFPHLHHLLGRSYTLSGRVCHGDQRGRTLGIPTANMEFHGLLLPPDGIYAARAVIERVAHRAAVYIGVRPTFGGGRRVVEVHLLDQGNPMLYGKRLEVEFVAHIRPDQTFESEAELQRVMADDIVKIRSVL